MIHETIPSRFDRQQRLTLWTRGCLLTAVFGVILFTTISIRLFAAGRRPVLDVPVERINPNTATMASLVRLPNIGRARAMDIIHYRQNRQQDGPAFCTVQDLEQIHGIGPKTAAKLTPWLTFENP